MVTLYCNLKVALKVKVSINHIFKLPILFTRGVAGTLAADLGMGDALAGIEERHGGLVADACRKTARTLVRNAAESVEHQVSFIRFLRPNDRPVCGRGHASFILDQLCNLSPRHEGSMPIGLLHRQGK